MDNEEQVVLVTPQDLEVGTLGKMEAHRLGALHRAFSVFLIDAQGKVLLQQRAMHKYHSGGLWSNACCGHPRMGEGIAEAAVRRTQEELGVTVRLQHRFRFHYRAAVGADITEHEVDHVFTGLLDHAPAPDPAEVMAVRWCTIDELDRELKAGPERFTAWLPFCWERVVGLLREQASTP